MGGRNFGESTKQRGTIARLWDILECEFSALISIRAVSSRTITRWGTRIAYRQNSQQRGLASILQADHRDIHLGGPIIVQFRSATYLWRLRRCLEFAERRDGTTCSRIDTAAETDQNNLNSQSYTRLNIPAMVAGSQSCPNLVEDALFYQWWAVAWKSRKARWMWAGCRSSRCRLKP